MQTVNPHNPYSNGENPEAYRYSNVTSFSFNQSLKYFESIPVQHLINSAGIGSDTRINAFGAEFQYLGAPGIEVFNKLITVAL